MKKLLIVSCLFAQVCLAQTSQIDSLKQGLVTLQKQPLSRDRDSVACYFNKKLMEAYTDIQVDSALQYNAALITLCQRQHFQQGLVKAYIYAGYLNRVKGADFESIRLLYKALLIAEKQNDNRQIAYIYYSIAHSYYNLNNYRKSLNFCEKGLALLKKYPDIQTEMEILNVYGSNYKQRKEYTLALKQYLKFYSIAKASRERWYEAQSLHEIGWAYEGLDQLDKAAVYYQNALKLAQSTKSFDLESSILLNLIGLFMKQHKWEKALQYSLNVQKQSVTMKNTSTLLETQEKLHRIYKKLGRTRESLEAYEHYITLKDSLNRETTEARIETLQAQYENVQHENTLKNQQVQLLSQQNKNQQLAQTRNSLFVGFLGILLATGLLFWNNRKLQAKNRQINQQKILLENAQEQLAGLNQSLEQRVQERTRELSEANSELVRKNEEIKEALFKGQTIERKRVAIELHENLSSLLSALNMSIQGINPKSLPEHEQIIYQNIRLMMGNAYAEVRNISHNILPNDLENEGLCNVLTKLISKLNTNALIHFTLHTTLPIERLPSIIEFNLYSIVLELINNVIRHSQATEALIQLHQTSADVKLTVLDNGRGIQPKFEQGIGLQNIQSRLDALGGTFQAMANKPFGTIISVQIPV